MSAALVLFVIGLAGLLGGLLVPDQPWLVRGAAMVLGVLFIIISAVLTAMRLYVKSKANEAFVRTGGRGSIVVLDGGLLVFPLFHNTVRISLETMKLEVERTEEDALITKDNLRVDVRGEFYIKVAPNKENILAAARSLGERGTHPDSVAALVFEKLVSALRSVAATMDLVEIHSRREEFARAVFESVREDLQHNGLTLESVTISRLDQTDQRALREDNIFDAQGKKKITEITQAALVESNRLQRDAERQRREKDVQTTQEILSLEQMQAEAEAAQRAEVAKINSGKQREQQEYAIEQERQVKEAEIARQQAIEAREIQQRLAVQSASIDADRELIQREQEKAQRDIERQQAVETARIAQEQAIEVAARQREVAVAQKEAERAAAQRDALEAEAAREKANQEVLTVQATSEADREAAKKLIAAKQVIEQDRIKRHTDAEVAAYTQLKQAEAEQESAKRRAAARLEMAEAEAKATERQAQAEQAQRMIEVNVERERVSVEQARVDVERQELENRQTFDRVAVEFETRKLQIAATRDVQIAGAEAVGEFMSRGQFQVFGDPTTMAQMMDRFKTGLGLGATLGGLLDGAPEPVRDLAGELGSTLRPLMKGAADRAAERLSGSGPTADPAAGNGAKAAGDPSPPEAEADTGRTFEDEAADDEA